MKGIYILLLAVMWCLPVSIWSQSFFVLEEDAGYDKRELTTYDRYFRPIGRRVVYGYRGLHSYDDFVVVRARDNGQDILTTYDRHLRSTGRKAFSHLKKYSATEEVIITIEVDPYTGREYLYTFSPHLRQYGGLELNPDVKSIRLTNGFILIERYDDYHDFRSYVQVYDKYLRVLGKKQVGL